MIGALKTRTETKASTVQAGGAVPAAPPDRLSAVLNWSALALILVGGVPLFLCMPFWFDVYHYDGCARTMMRGGVLYRDVFDNNLPGVIWLHAALRSLVGWQPEMLHLADLVFFTVDVLLLVRWVPSRATRLVGGGVLRLLSLHPGNLSLPARHLDALARPRRADVAATAGRSALVASWFGPHRPGLGHPGRAVLGGGGLD